MFSPVNLCKLKKELQCPQLKMFEDKIGNKKINLEIIRKKPKKKKHTMVYVDFFLQL